MFGSEFGVECTVRDAWSSGYRCRRPSSGDMRSFVRSRSDGLTSRVKRPTSAFYRSGNVVSIFVEGCGFKHLELQVMNEPVLWP